LKLYLSKSNAYKVRILLSLLKVPYEKGIVAWIARCKALPGWAAR